jgi:hypothetical protein
MLIRKDVLTATQPISSMNPRVFFFEEGKCTLKEKRVGCQSKIQVASSCMLQSTVYIAITPIFKSNAERIYSLCFYLLIPRFLDASPFDA